MEIIRIIEKDNVTNLESGSFLFIKEYLSGEVKVVLKPVKVRDENNPNLVVDYCQELNFNAIEPIKFFNL